MVKKSMSSFSFLKKKLIELFINFKDRPLSTLKRGVSLLCFLLLINVICNFIGATISTDNLFLFLVSLITKIAIFKLINIIIQ